MRFFLVALVLAPLAAAIGLVAGIFLGGNFATNVELFGLRGYEATAWLGAGVGLVCGGLLAARLNRWI